MTKLNIENIEFQSDIDAYRALSEEKSLIDKELKRLKAKIFNDNKPNGQFGTFNYDGFQIVIAKKVKWDQEVLAQKAATYNFVDTKYNVTETLYKALPEDIQEELADARTVEQGTISIKIKD